MLPKYVKKPFSNPVEKIPKIQNIGALLDIYMKGNLLIMTAKLRQSQ